jgi:hypothetical protein
VRRIIVWGNAGYASAWGNANESDKASDSNSGYPRRHLHKHPPFKTDITHDIALCNHPQ